MIDTTPSLLADGYAPGLGVQALDEQQERLAGPLIAAAAAGRMNVALQDQVDAAAAHSAELMRGIAAPERLSVLDVSTPKADRLLWMLAHCWRRVDHLMLCPHLLTGPQPVFTYIGLPANSCRDCCMEIGALLAVNERCDVCLQPSEWFHPFTTQHGVFTYLGEICPTCSAFLSGGTEP
jgi:hypothetical protein